MLSRSVNNYFQHLIRIRAFVIGLIGIGFFALAFFMPTTSTNASYPGGEWDSNAIVKGGVGTCAEISWAATHGDNLLKNSFSAVGLDAGEACSVVSGYVYNNNKVTIGDKIVATGAYTYGRQYISGSSQIAGGAWQRPPSVSFRSTRIPAYVYMVNGQFKWAILKTCGNPVKATPTFVPRPNMSINKKVTTDLSSNSDGAFFLASEQVTAKKGSTVRFVSQANNTGNTAEKIIVSDTLPAGTSYVSGTFQQKRAGRVILSGNLGAINSNTYGTVRDTQPGDEVKIDIKARYNTTSKVRNIACVAIDVNKNGRGDSGEPVKCDVAYVNHPATPQPPQPPQPPRPPVTNPILKMRKYVGSVTKPNGYNDANVTPITVGAGHTITYKLDVTNSGNATSGKIFYGDQVEKLIGTAVDINTLQITKANVPNARIVTVDGKKWIKSDAFTVKPGESKYIEFRVRVKSTYSGNFDNIGCISASATSTPVCDNARVTVPRPPAPVAACVSLTSRKIGINEYNLIATASKANGAVIRGYRFTFGDGTTKTVNSSANTVTETKLYQYQASDITASVTVLTSVGEKTAPACRTTFKLEQPRITCDSITANTIDRTTRQFVVSATAYNGATINRYLFDIGNNNVITSNTPQTTINFTDPGTYTVKASVVGSTGTVTSTDCQVTVNIAEEEEPSLDIEKKVTADLATPVNEAGFSASSELVTVKPNAEVKFIIRLTNTGTIALKNLKIRDVLPDGLSLVEGNQNPVVGNLEPGESYYFAVNARASDEIGATTVTNVVCVVHDTNEDGQTDLDCSQTNCPKNPDVKPETDLHDCDDARVKIVPEIVAPPNSRPDRPGVLPNTGPLSSAMAGIILIAVSIRWWIVSKRELATKHLN